MSPRAFVDNTESHGTICAYAQGRCEFLGASGVSMDRKDLAALHSSGLST